MVSMLFNIDRVLIITSSLLTEPPELPNMDCSTERV